MPLDLSDDFDVFDFTETVSYVRRGLDGSTTTTYTDVTALRVAITGDFLGIGEGGGFLSDSTRWHIKESTLAVSPRRGDRIVSTDSGTWEVVNDHAQTRSTRYVCDCKKVS